MILTRFVICSETRGKPVTRQVLDTRAEAEKILSELKERDAGQEHGGPEDSYWIAEVGPESEAWRWLVPHR